MSDQPPTPPPPDSWPPPGAGQQGQGAWPPQPPGQQWAPGPGTAPGGQPWPQPVHYRPVPTDAFGRPLAEWWKRLVALIVDSVVLNVPISIVFGVLFGLAGADIDVDPVTGEVTGLEGLAGAMGVYAVVALVVSWAYFAVLNGSQRGQTIGKMALRIQVRDARAEGGPIGVGRGAVRYLLPGPASWFTCGLLALVDGLWPLWDERREALHDKLAGSVVVDVGRTAAPPGWPTQT